MKNDTIEGQPEVKFEKAGPQDYDEVIDLGNYVFSHSRGPCDFPIILPKLYKREYFSQGIHYLAREGGKIKAVAGAYPLVWEFRDQNNSVISLPGRGIGMVSVHPYARSRGFMKDLMNRAMDDMKRDGIVFACLSGFRQRYEYFGFAPTGNIYTFTCNEYNIRHVLGPQWSSGLSLIPLGPEDKSLLNQIHALHETKPIRIQRPREMLFDILTSWKARAFAVTNGSNFEGYLVCKRQGTEQEITEINLRDLSRLPEVLGLFMREGRKSGMQEKVEVSSCPQEGEKIAVLSGFAESYSQGPAYHYAVFDYKRFAGPFLNFVSRGRKLANGSVTLQIEGEGRLRLSVENGSASLTDTSDSAELFLNRLEALDFFFSPLASYTIPAIGKSPFLQSLLPLPLSFENTDGV